MSRLFRKTINTSENNKELVLVTTQRVQNDVNGNPKHFIQVWLQRGSNNGNIWAPKVKGYRLTKHDGYNIISFNIEQDIDRFIQAFENAIKH